ncbi:hypothetical protein GGS23DRAFT_88617 [Durotheca rogersii]|uniref:uncharacterized protein n=1 Tax=Durotheca rogersii TaxID=419775 RepID=UPI002220D628|nr:uncharacterized protein GGS23DRAFT_88617 [Durotheca rogersii]KAI5862705.1 hypothetical protein GGS23DRAFT_88617 [Durotheca rogersii]
MLCQPNIDHFTYLNPSDLSWRWAGNRAPGGVARLAIIVGIIKGPPFSPRSLFVRVSLIRQERGYAAENDLLNPGLMPVSGKAARRDSGNGRNRMQSTAASRLRTVRHYNTETRQRIIICLQRGQGIGRVVKGGWCSRFWGKKRISTSHGVPFFFSGTSRCYPSGTFLGLQVWLVRLPRRFLPYRYLYEDVLMYSLHQVC